MNSVIANSVYSPTPYRAAAKSFIGDLRSQYRHNKYWLQPDCPDMPTLWTDSRSLLPLLRFLKAEISHPFAMLYDLTAIDERLRINRGKGESEQPKSDFTLVYQLLSVQRDLFIRIKLALPASHLSAPSATSVWTSANWYEREIWDLFGIEFIGHPNLRRILMPSTWLGHPLRKDHHARATEVDPFKLTAEKQRQEQEALRFKPEEWGMARASDSAEFMFLNLGPNHPSVHGVFRVALQLDGERIIDAVPDIGYHHRGAEKMAERQAWHTFMPYTDRIDYLGGVMNNLPYVLALEQLAGIPVPSRAQVIRVMLCELFRIASHLVFYGTFAQDVGQMSPVFYMFVDREKLFGIIEAITGGRMHPAWFRIGGVAQDLPRGWDKLVREFLDYMPKRLREYEGMVLKNKLLQKRTRGIGVYNTQEALEWGVTGPGLRATGLEWDLRKRRPYSGYDQFEFDIPCFDGGDCFDRCRVRVEEIWQSLRIIRQCLDNMPPGPYKSDHPLTTPPRKSRTMHDIETLIQHFVNNSWGPVMPPGEVCYPVEATKGVNSYQIISDGGNCAYRTRIRTPSFPHLQMIPLMARGLLVADLIAIIASIDFVMADVDR
ncbi:NADH dehydrogenase subunit C /NADH dehydrogenase subunit D [Microbulbifer thermotolerans]|uniref:NADH-quinone oxidoreductase subunit C/D n=1 Tax=Microbulbifer thermotolerans TaxID=252514 RepID=UPI0008E5D0D7|nr:NADH-quinone oxidoreductase subunit C/D [Microbulbifer thermotolerans]MCX2795699.1 NADH-quinone oxidoreductase subunit C/D [Microbulbifer thermotolerans]MCX2835332.1 NADH-quinone oxidoreductase subunit C/D [Microbulbifer thermotolerans]SFC68473.1 NADH dehydrogenase subunit C /NADH dehydrogenase subunit D [Microbulbifer thermotolerans]